MNPSRFFMPRMMGSAMRPMINSSFLPIRGNMGLFSKITNSLRAFNWSGLLNGANKTLNVVNQTIPLVRQAGPMLNNMKSIIRVAKAFGNETTAKNSNINLSKTVSDDKKIINEINSNYILQKKETQNINYPSFFI